MTQDTQAPPFKPSDIENEMMSILISVPMRSAHRLMAQLYPDDSFYKSARHAWTSAGDSKKIFLYGVCVEVLKAVVNLARDRDSLQEVPETGPRDILGKAMFVAFEDSQAFRKRKLLELLCLLIQFSSNRSKDEEYRVYLNAENFDLTMARQREFNELFGERISNVQYSIDDYWERIERDLQALNVPSLWFLDGKKVVRRRQGKEVPPSILNGWKSFFIGALQVASPDQRHALGIAYQRSYSVASRSIHPMLGAHTYARPDYDPREAISNVTQASLIAMHVMHLAYQIADIQDSEGITSALGKNFERSPIAKLIEPYSREYETGDFVLTAYGDPAEITDVRRSRFGGYRAYRVRFLGKPPLPEFPEDWLEARLVGPGLIPRREIRSWFEENSKRVLDSHFVDRLPEIPDDELRKAVCAALRELHERGVLLKAIRMAEEKSAGEASPSQSS